WLDDTLGWGKGQTDAEAEVDMLNNLEVILDKLLLAGIKLSAEKVAFFLKEATWCGKILSGDGVRHDPKRIQGLADMGRPETAADLMQFLCSVNWMRTHLPQLAEVAAPLQALLKQKMDGQRKRTKQAAFRLAISAAEWTADCESSWLGVKSLLEEAVMLAHPREGWALLGFTDASDMFWGTMLTQVPKHELATAVAVEDMSHEPLAFLSGSFSGARLHWSATDKEAYPIVILFQRFEHLLWQQVHLYCDHRALAYVFHPHRAIYTVSKATSQRLNHWAVYLAQFDYSIEHLAGLRNMWADLLSRWRTKTGVTTSQLVGTTFGPHTRWSAMMEAFPTRAVIRAAQSAALQSEGLGEGVDDQSLIPDLLYRDGLNWLAENKQVVWIPDNAKELQMRLMVVAHSGAGGHRAHAATLAKLGDYKWTTMEADVRKFVKDCLNCKDMGKGMKVPRPYGPLTHGKRFNSVVHMDFLFLGEADFDYSLGIAAGGYKYLLVIMDDYSQLVMLVPTVTCSASVAAQSLMQWMATYNGGIEVIISDGPTHFKNQLLYELGQLMGWRHHFTIAYMAHTNGTIERIMREIIGTFKALLNQAKLQPDQWLEMVSVVQFALNSAYRERKGFTPFQMALGSDADALKIAIQTEAERGWSNIP
ncbi:unnamed protein product, partial [Chrysoparadoxa australica]